MDGIWLCIRRKSWSFVAIALWAVMPLNSALHAKDTHVEFDTSFSVACHPLPAASVDMLPSDRMVVEARVRLSARVRRGDAEEVHEMVYTISSPEQRLRVFDYSPRSVTESDIEGTIEAVESTEAGNSLDASIGLGIPLPVGAATGSAAPSVGGGRTERTTLKKSYQQIAPRQVVLTSGTISREHGVFFKIRSAREQPLEGTREFVLRFLVPRDWAGDWVKVQCMARGERDTPWKDSPETLGGDEFYVGLYRADVLPARDTARALAEWQLALLSRSEANAPRKQKFPQKFVRFVEAAFLFPMRRGGDKADDNEPKSNSRALASRAEVSLDQGLSATLADMARWSSAGPEYVLPRHAPTPSHSAALPQAPRVAPVAP